MLRTLFVIILLVLLPNTSFSGDCKRFVKLHSAKKLAKIYEKSALPVFQSHKTNLWEKSTEEGKGELISKMPPKARAILLDETEKDYKIKNPLDESIGWVSKKQAKKTGFRNTETLKRCNPKKIKKKELKKLKKQKKQKIL